MTSLDYFKKVVEDDLKAVVKPQYVDQIPKAIKKDTDRTVGALLKARSQMDNLEQILDELGMNHLVDRFYSITDTAKNLSTSSTAT